VKVNIVSYEDPGLWILGKFARKLHEEVSRAGFQCALTRNPDPSADINHHISYINYRGEISGTDTVMITHVDTVHKFQMLKSQLVKARMAICMSRETQSRLVSAGRPSDRLCDINPAHDQAIKPRPLVLGITSNVYADGRKGAEMIVALCRRISPQDFRFIIMGADWQEPIGEMRALGFSVDYYDVFDYGKYTEIVPAFDYYLYVAHDEGSMGFLDALCAGVPTIVTPQGYHLDAPGGLTHSINNADELAAACLAIAAKRRTLTQAVASWTWANYARKHIDLWRRLLEGPSAPRLDGEPYLDGVESLYTENAPVFSAEENRAFKASLLKNSSRTFHSYFPEGKVSVPVLYGYAVKLAKKLLRL
jgi:hypothetical protein